MDTVKQEVNKLLKTLPDNCSLEDIQYHLYVLQKVDHGLKDAKAGKVYSQNVLEKRMSKWFKK